MYLCLIDHFFTSHRTILYEKQSRNSAPERCCVSHYYGIWHLGLLVGSLLCVEPKSSAWRPRAWCCQTGQKAVPCLSEHLESGAKSKQLSGEKDVKNSHSWLLGFTWGWVAEQEGEGWCSVLKVTPLQLQRWQSYLGESGSQTPPCLCVQSLQAEDEKEIEEPGYLTGWATRAERKERWFILQLWEIRMISRAGISSGESDKMQVLSLLILQLQEGIRNSVLLLILLSHSPLSRRAVCCLPRCRLCLRSLLICTGSQGGNPNCSDVLAIFLSSVASSRCFPVNAEHNYSL